MIQHRWKTYIFNVSTTNRIWLLVGVMAKRKENHYNNNVIIDNKVVSVSDLQTNAKSASMRFLVLVLGITLLASMVVPYLSMAAAATSTSNAFNGTVIPGYSMGGLELTAYGVNINSWGQVSAGDYSFVRSNYGIWNPKNAPKDGKLDIKVDDTGKEQDSLLNSADKAVGWEQATGRTNYTKNSPNGDEKTAQNQKSDDVSPVRTISDVTYWNSKTPKANSTNDANITVSLVPDFIIVSADEDGNATILQAPSEANNNGNSIVSFDGSTKSAKYTNAHPIYLSLSDLMESYGLSSKDNKYNTMDDLFKAAANNPAPLNALTQDKQKNLLCKTIYSDLNSHKSSSESSMAFNPYPYTMVFSTNDSLTHQIVYSSIYENCEAYAYFSPTVVYQKYLQVKTEYNSIYNSATKQIQSNDPVTMMQLGYYAAAMSILEAYLSEALPQDMTRGYVGMSEIDSIRGENGNDIGEVGKKAAGKMFTGTAKSFQKVTYATLMYDVASQFAKATECNIAETSAIMDSLSVFGYGDNNTSKPNVGVMKGLTADENMKRRTMLTPRSDESMGVVANAQKNVESDPDNPRTEKNAMHQVEESQDNDGADIADPDYAGIYTPVYYPIQQHKMPDNEKTYRFSVLATIPYTTAIQYIGLRGKLSSGVMLTYSSNFTASFTSTQELISGTNKDKVAQLVDQYNSGDEKTNKDLGTYQANKSIVIHPNSSSEDNSSSDTTGTSLDNAIPDTVDDRVDAALAGYSAGNMTSDNVHDLVDVMRALPGGKYETFNRFFNPLKSDGDDQDIFVARVTPAVTTYFPSLLVNGYENAGGKEVPNDCATANVSFDYFSVPSFAPCFASHTGSKTYYGSLNYELRAFYKKGFISTLSSKSNIPQVEELTAASEATDEAAKKMSEENAISAETMKTNIKTIFVEAKRVASAKALTALEQYGKGSSGTMSLSTVAKYFNADGGGFKKLFSCHIQSNTIKLADGSNYSTKPNETHASGGSAGNSPTTTGGSGPSTSSPSGMNGAENSGNVSYKEGNSLGNSPTTTGGSVSSNPLKAGMAPATDSQTITVNKAKWNWDDVTSDNESKLTVKVGGKNRTINKIYWKVPDNESTEKFGQENDEAAFILDALNNINDGKAEKIFDRNGEWGCELGDELTNNNNRELAVNMIAYADSMKLNDFAPPVYCKEDKFFIVETEEYLKACDSYFLSTDSPYYWGLTYRELETLNGQVSILSGEGGIVDGEDSDLFIVGYSPKWLYDDSKESVKSSDYLKAAEKQLNEACKELFKDIINDLKDQQLIISSMPSQMQNCLAWADYQNASDSEAQYQSDPTDTVDINLAKDTDASDDYDTDNTITGLNSLQKAGFSYSPETGATKVTSEVTGATQSAIQARMVRGVEGSTWTCSVQPACYTITAIIARIDSMQNSGVSYPYSNIYSGRLRSGADQYSLLQAHVIDYSSIASGITGDLATRVRGKVVSITNPNYGALPDFLNILGTIGGLIAEATSGFANLTGGMFEDAMWNGNGESATKVATSDNQTGDGTIETKKYDGTGNIERKGSMWVLDSAGGQSFYTLVQSLALVLVLVSLLYIAFKNFYEYTRPAGTSVPVDEKNEAGKKSAAAESKILAATQLKVVMPRAIIAVFMIGLPPMSGAGFQGGNFLLLQMLSSIFNQISHVFMNLNGQSVMNLWLNTGADLLSDNPGIGEYLAYGAAMLVIGIMFVVGTLAVLLADVMLILFYIIGPLMWALYVWPYNDTTSKTKNPDGIIAKLTSRMKFAWTGGRVGNKAPEGMIECYCETAMLNVMWSVIFWAITIVFTGVTGTISTDTSSTPGNTATLAGAATVSNAAYAKSALMSTGNYYASASVAHADGLFNAGILPMPAWVRMLIAAALAVVVFMLMIRMASSMFKKSLGNTFAAVSAVGGAIRGGAIGGALGHAAELAKAGTNVAAMAGNAKNIADRARNAVDNFNKAGVRGRLHQIGNAGRSLGSHGANALRKAEQAANTAGKYISGDKNLTDGFTNAVRGINNHLNDNAAANQKDNLKRLNGARESINKLQDAIGANDLDQAQAILDTMTPEEKRLAAHYAPSLFERNRGGHDLRLRAGVTNHDFDRARRELDDRIEIAEARADRHVRNSNNALTPAQVRERNLAAAGIDDLAALTNTLLSADSNDRTKRAARRQLSEYSRRAFGENIDWDQKGGDRQAVHDLLARDRNVPTADDRATRISDAISNAAATGREEAKSFATRHQIGAYEGDASQVITRELGRASHAIAASLPNVTAAASDISGIRTTVDTQLSTIADVYKNRGYTDIEANARALDVLEGHFGGIDAARARFLSSEITNGGEISNGDAIRLELFKQRYNLGESTVGDKIVESGAGFKTTRYVSNLSKVPERYLNSGAQAAIADMNIQQAYEDYVNSYPISSDAYHASYEHMLDNFPAGRERREMRNIMQNSPFNALFASGRDITRNDIDTLIESADRSGHPIDPKAISAMETVYSEVRQQAVENDAAFKDNLLASLPADSSYSSADDAINALDGRQIDTNALTAEVRNSVNDQLTRAQGAFDAATNRINTLTTEIGNTKSQLRHAGKELKDAKKRGDTGEMTRWNDEIRRLKGQLGIQNTELGTETSNQRIAQKSVEDIQGYIDSITAVNQAPNPLSPTGRDDN